MHYTGAIAKKYLFSRKEFTFINIISLLATLGITFGVAALIVVLSVFNGFNGLVTSILLDFDPHLKLERIGGGAQEDFTRMEMRLRQLPEVSGMAPYVQRKAMLVSRDANLFAWIKGIDPARTPAVSRVTEKIVLGNFRLGGKNEVVLGITLADKLRVLVGDTVTVISPAGMEQVLTQYVTPTILRCRVGGIYQTDNKIYDGSYAFIALPAAQYLFRLGDLPTGLDVRLKDIAASDPVRDILQREAGSAWNVQSWYDLHKDLYSVMKIERWSAFILLCVIIAVAVFNIFASLTMLVLEKQRDIGILRAMGATATDIQRLFLRIGALIGVGGTIVGLAFGLTLCLLQQQYGLIHLDAAFIIPSLPVEIRASDVVIISASTMILCLVAALYPARRARGVAPMEAIRWE